jgi:hypothetical protein
VQAFNLFLPEGVSDDHHLRAQRLERAGERATDAVRAADHSHLFAAESARGEWLPLSLKIAAANSVRLSQ